MEDMDDSTTRPCTEIIKLHIYYLSGVPGMNLYLGCPRNGFVYLRFSWMGWVYVGMSCTKENEREREREKKKEDKSETGIYRKELFT